MSPLELVKLSELMALSSGSRDLKIGLIDEPVAANNSGFLGTTIREISNKYNYFPNSSSSPMVFSCWHL